MIRIITIEREFGAGGSAVAERLARQLGWKLLDQELTGRIARLAKVDLATARRCDERVDSPLYRLAKVFLRGSFERQLPLDDAPFDADRMVELARQVITRAAQEGECVIVGRGAPWILRHRDDTFHVFLYASREDKLRNLSSEYKDEKEAAEMVDTIDQERAAFIKRYFGKEWPTRSLYHMMINTKVGYEQTVETILHGIRQLDAQAAVKTS